MFLKVSKGAKIRNRHNQVPHLTQHTNGKVTILQIYTTHESQEVSPFPAGDHKAQINRHAQRHNKHKTEKNIKDPQSIFFKLVKGILIYLNLYLFIFPLSHNFSYLFYFCNIQGYLIQNVTVIIHWLEQS